MDIAVSVELNVPSGKMVFANDLRDGFFVMGSHDINTPEGIVAESKSYEDVGMVHLFVGNSCPAVYQYKNGSFVVGSGRGRDGKLKEVAGICTDLWWYSVVDYDEYIRRYGKKPSKNDCDVVKVKPGVYRFDHLFPTGKPSYDVHTFSKAKFVREPDSLVDYLAIEKERQFTAEQYVGNAIHDWPTLYKVITVTIDTIWDINRATTATESDDPELIAAGEAYLAKEKKDWYARLKKGESITEILNWDDRPIASFPFEDLPPRDKMLSVARVADSVFLLGGSGNDWHPNGWCAAAPMNGSLQLEIPLFDEPIEWSNITDRYTVFHRATGLVDGTFYEHMPEVKFNKSFLSFACNVLQNMIRFGVVKPPVSINREKLTAEEIEKRSTEQKAEAKKLLTHLVERYPDLIPDYTKDLVE